MPPPGIQDLRREIGAAGAAALPDFAGVSPEAIATLVAVLREAKLQQRKLLEESAENSLKMVPALLRPAVRKVLFG